MPLFKKPDDGQNDGTVDAPYTGLDQEMVKETLSQSEQEHLRFVRWGIRHNRGGFHEFLLNSEKEDDDTDD